MIAKKYLIFLIVAIGIVSAAGYLFLLPREEIIEDPTLRAIKTRGTIIVGTDATYPPMESIDEEGNFVGLDIDIAKEIASDLGVKAEFRNIVWDELISFEPLYRGEVDMLIASITITPERAEQVTFSDPYFNAGQVIITTFDKVAEIKGPEDLAGKKIGTQPETTCEIEARKLTAQELVILYGNFYLAKEALLAGEIDAIVSDYSGAVGLVAGEANLKIIGEPFTQEFYGIAVRKEDNVLLGEINKTIRRLKRENILESLEMKWLAQ